MSAYPMAGRIGEVRLAWIIGRLNVGGPAVHLLAAATALARRGYRSVVLAGQPGLREADLTAEARARGLEVVSIPDLVRAVDPVRDARAALQILRELRRFRPDVVQTQTAKAGALGRIAARAARVPVVVHTFHGHVFEGYFGRVASRAVVAAERLLAHAADALVAISPSVGAELTGRYRVRGAPLTVLPLGIELEPFLSADARRGELRAELGLPADAFVVAYAGRLIGIKDLPLLLEAMERLVASGGRAVLLLVGDGDRRASLEAEVRARGLEGHVRFTGWRRDMDRVYADADVVALSSRSEGTPVVLMEAMAAGRPVVATRVGGVPDLFADGQAGLLVPPGDAGALAAALESLRADPARRQSLGAEGRRIARQRFGIEQTSTELDAFYRGLLARKAPAAAAP